MTTSKRSNEILLSVLLTAACICACESREVGSQTKSAATAEEQGGEELVFSDDFERDALGEDWVRGTGEAGPGQWTIRDGWVTGQALKNDPLWLKRELPEQVRVEFDARALSPEGDLKVEIFGDGTNHASGYVLIFGGWKNTLDAVARLDEHGEDRKARRTRGVTQNVVYHMAIERRDGTITWSVDGEPFMTYEDDEPLKGPQHAHFAFSDWTAPVQFDNVEVYALQ